MRCEPGWRFEAGPSRPLTDHLCWYVWAGEGELVTGGESVPLRPGMMCIMRPAGQYEGRQDLSQRLGVTYIHFDVPAGPLLPEATFLADPAYADAVTRRIVALMRGPDPGVTGHRIAGHLMAALLADVTAMERPALERRRDPRGERAVLMVRRAADRILEDPGQAPTIERLASEMAQSPGHFTRVFRQVHGICPKAFVLKARLDRAAQLLRETALPVVQVAEIMGYASPQFFTRQYKARFGSLPSEVRGARR